jgi:hypothetical protein
MKSIYRVNKSRDQWKQKASQRALGLREARKREKQHVAKIENLEERTSALCNEVDDLKQALAVATNPVAKQSDQTIRVVCVLLVIQGVVSFRSVPRILLVLLGQAILGPIWVPHFTSVINWTLRVGLSRLESVQIRSGRWIAIIDTSIDIGVRKALVVLRVSLDVMAQRAGALTLADCECIGLHIGAKWNGDTVKDALTAIFAKSGLPAAIIKDQGKDLKKGVELFLETIPNQQVWIIGDIGHMVANALKGEFASLKAFKSFLKVMRKGAARLRQTDLADLMPPKIRTKGRFQSISRVVEWAKATLALIGGQGRAPDDSQIARLRKAFLGLSGLKGFLEKFIVACQIGCEFMKVLKNNGLNQETYAQAKRVLNQLPEDSKIREKLLKWLELTLTIQCRLSIGQTPLVVSSDVIESLFGKFKETIQRSPRGELNRLALTIPTLCGNFDACDIEERIAATNHSQLKQWVQRQIPETIQQKKLKNLLSLRRNVKVPETGNAA